MAAVREGDSIYFDLPGRRLEVEVEAEDLPDGWPVGPRPPFRTGGGISEVWPGRLFCRPLCGARLTEPQDSLKYSCHGASNP
jgi:hypothetical protein